MSEFRQSISESTYQILIGTFGAKWIDNLTSNYQNAKLQYSDMDKDNFISSIGVQFSTKYRYLDAESETVTKELTGNLVITISNDMDIIVAVHSIQSKMAGDLLKATNKNVWVDYETLKKRRE